MLGVSQNTVVNWKREKRPIIGFMEKYFDDEDVEEYLHSGSLKWIDYVRESDFSKLRILRDVDAEELKEIFDKARKYDLLSELLTPFLDEKKNRKNRP